MRLLLPVACPVCGMRGSAPCPTCVASMRRAPGLPPVPGVDACHALLDYAGAGRELLARLKYRNARASIPFLAQGMADLVAGRRFDVATWAPTARARARRRGFDQAELLARAVAARLGVPCRALLSRRLGPAQTGRALADRRFGPRFRARLPAIPARVLLVDDVVTSGATVAAAATALRAAGALRIDVVVAARTPPPRSRLQSGVALCGSVVESRSQP